jgi:colanic acid/amylovoran biosynthesis glycosyltransferase
LTTFLNKAGQLLGKGNLGYNFFLSKEIVKFKPDVVLAQYSVTALNVYKKCVDKKIPFVIHFHGYDAHTYSLLNNNREAFLDMFQKCAASLVVSKSMFSELVAFGAHPEKTFLNPCGVNVKEPFVKDPVKSSYLTIGRFVDKKAPHLTILAFNHFAKKFPDAKLTMIGDGPLLGSSKDLAEALSIASKINFLGALPHDKTKQYLSKSFAFLQHSVRAVSGDSEGSPVAIMEAGLYGIPVVSTRHAGIPEIVKDGVTGYLVDEKDIYGMAAAMEKLETDYDGNLGINAQAHIIDNYSDVKLIGRMALVLNWAANVDIRKPTVFPDFGSWKII